MPRPVKSKGERTVGIVITPGSHSQSVLFYSEKILFYPPKKGRRNIFALGKIQVYTDVQQYGTSDQGILKSKRKFPVIRV